MKNTKRIARIAAIVLVLVMMMTGMVFADSTHGTKIQMKSGNPGSAMKLEGYTWTAQGGHFDTDSTAQIVFDETATYTVYNTNNEEIGTMTLIHHGNGNKNNSGNGTDVYWAYFTEKVEAQEEAAEIITEEESSIPEQQVEEIPEEVTEQGEPEETNEEEPEELAEEEANEEEPEEIAEEETNEEEPEELVEEETNEEEPEEIAEEETNEEESEEIAEEETNEESEEEIEEVVEETEEVKEETHYVGRITKKLIVAEEPKDEELEEIEDEEAPLADAPEEVELFEEDVPLADAPQTGDNGIIASILGILTAIAALGTCLRSKKNAAN